MSKREIIDHIQKLNATASAEFLARFSDEELLAYLNQLEEVVREQVRRHTEPDVALAATA